MVQVRHVGVSVPHGLVHVLVGVGLGTFVAAVRVLVVLVVDVAVTVGHVLVSVLMRMPLRQYQPGCGEHQYQGGDERGG